MILSKEQTAMHIGLVSPTDIEDSPTWGGIHTHTKALFDLLRRLGHRVTLITCGRPNAVPRSYPDSSKILTLPIAVSGVVDKSFSKAARDVILQLLANDPMALVLSEGHSGMGLVGSAAPPSSPPLIAFAHNFGFIHFRNNWQEVHSLRTFLNYVIISFPRIVSRFLTQEWPFFRACRAVVSGSRFNTRFLSTFYCVPPEKLHVIQNWVDCAVFRPDAKARAIRRKELGIPANALVYLLVGSTWRPKGFHVALEAFGRLAQSGKDVWLVMAGPGTNNEAARSTAAGFIPSLDRLRFLGPADHAGLPSLFGSSAIRSVGGHGLRIAGDRHRHWWHPRTGRGHRHLGAV
jgi:glycosyltransferase involved in cell wall biosynthesis